jgi:LPS-assembly lipoprotein
MAHQRGSRLGRDGAVSLSALPFPVALIAALVMLVLGGCGFHLRGSVDLPPDLSPLYVQAGGAVGTAIQDRLPGSGVQTTRNPADAGLTLRILSESRDSRVVALDQSGKALAYMLTYRVRFEAQDGAGNLVMPSQMITLDRTFDDNPDVSVLGKQQESDIIYQDLVSDAADQVLLRLRSTLASRQASGST